MTLHRWRLPIRAALEDVFEIPSPRLETSLR